MIQLAWLGDTCVTWKAESITFLMLAPGGDVDPYVAFQNLIGRVPEALNALPPNQPGKVAGGPLDNFYFQIVARLGRVELILTVPPSDSGVGMIEDPIAALGKLVELAKKSLGLMPVNRLSFLTNLAVVTEDQGAAARLFFDRTRICPVESEPVDLIFQYNQPSEATDGTRINRVVKWGITHVQLIQIAVGTLPLTRQAEQKNYSTLNLLLDINVVPSTAPLTPDQMLRLIDDLAHQTSSLILSTDA